MDATDKLYRDRLPEKHQIIFDAMRCLQSACSAFASAAASGRDSFDLVLAYHDLDCAMTALQNVLNPNRWGSPFASSPQGFTDEQLAKFKKLGKAMRESMDPDPDADWKCGGE